MKTPAERVDVLCLLHALDETVSTLLVTFAVLQWCLDDEAERAVGRISEGTGLLNVCSMEREH